MLQETPYPNDESLQKSLQDKVNWDAYRRKTLKTLIRELPTKQRRMQDLLVHRRSKPDMSLGEDLKEAIKKIQRKDDDTWWSNQSILSRERGWRDRSRQRAALNEKTSDHTASGSYTVEQWSAEAAAMVGCNYNQ